MSPSNLKLQYYYYFQNQNQNITCSFLLRHSCLVCLWCGALYSIYEYCVLFFFVMFARFVCGVVLLFYARPRLGWNHHCACIHPTSIQHPENRDLLKTNTLSTMNFFHKHPFGGSFLATLVGFAFLLPVLVVSIVMSSSDTIEQSLYIQTNKNILTSISCLQISDTNIHLAKESHESSQQRDLQVAPHCFTIHFKTSSMRGGVQVWASSTFLDMVTSLLNVRKMGPNAILQFAEEKPWTSSHPPPHPRVFGDLALQDTLAR